MRTGEIDHPPDRGSGRGAHDERRPRGTLLVTGATGVVGAELSRRAAGRGWSVTRTARRAAPGVVAWEMGSPPPAELQQDWTAIVHTAARPRWTMDRDEAVRANVDTMEPVLRLAERAGHLVHVSSAFATGLTGSVESTSLEDYRNTYEWSKAAAERRLAGLATSYDIVRPPLVVGRRDDGMVARFTGMYTFLGAFTNSQLPALVADREARMELVSTSDVADCCLDLAEARLPGPEAVPGAPAGPVAGTGPTVATLGCGPAAMTCGEAFDVISEELDRWRAGHGLGPMPWPRVVSSEQWHRFFKPLARRSLSDRQVRILDLLEPFVPYLSLGEVVPVSWPVPSMSECLRRCAKHWCDSHPQQAARDLRSWRA